MTRAVLALAFAPALAACDNSDAVRRPDPHTNRMLVQPRAEPYGESTVFADGRAMRRPPAGTVAHERDDETRPETTAALLAEGRGRFDTVCAACHATDGSADSVVATKMSYRLPPSFHEDRIRALSDDTIYRVIGTGYGFMPSYAAVLSPRERWAVVAYVRALQLSRRATVADLPAGVRTRLTGALP